MPELRKDPIIDRWVIIAVERSRKPQSVVISDQPSHEDECPFCEGKETLTPPEICAIRDQQSQKDKPGWEVRVIPSQSPLLGIEGELNRRRDGVFDVMNGIGAHEIVLESPHHVRNIAELDEVQIGKIIGVFVERVKDLEKDKRFKYVLIFKNHGKSAGAGEIAHSRSQLIATPVTPKRIKEELLGSKKYFDFNKRCIYCDIIKQESNNNRRVVVDSKDFIAIAPFASRFPFEVWIMPRKHNCDFVNIEEKERISLAGILKNILQKLKIGLGDPSYNLIVHTAPFRREKSGHWSTICEDYHWHIEIMPRIIQVAGFEWGTGFYICPIAPEDAAKYLREN